MALLTLGARARALIRPKRVPGTLRAGGIADLVFVEPSTTGRAHSARHSVTRLSTAAGLALLQRIHK
eukprot:1811991-Rhodomonas_salina.5